MQRVWLSGDKKLLLTNTAVTSSLLGISDILQQWISGDYNSDQNKPFNVTRTSLLIYYFFRQNKICLCCLFDF
uniref:Uncharacterized protein n=1 Tax=Elaeophora elaphi TaxID=1147741 RepID=A0A0R3RWI6_9BILA